jgi:hypothetical protein
MAPMTRGVTDTQKHGFVFVPRFFKRIIIPREPVYGIVRVLQKVGRFFLRKTVRVNGGHGQRVFRHAGGRKMKRGEFSVVTGARLR